MTRIDIQPKLVSTYLLAWRAWLLANTAPGPKPVGSQLGRIVRNANKANRVHDKTEPDPARFVVPLTDEQALEIECAIPRLDPYLGKLIKLRYKQGNSVMQIAEQTRIAPRTVDRRLARAMHELMPLLTKLEMWRKTLIISDNLK